MKTIIEMAREAGLWPAVTDIFPKELKAFAELVRADAMGLKSVHNCEKWGEHMTEEDEEFQRIEREAKMRRMAEEDDDIQVYKKPWVNLTVDELIDLEHKHLSHENLTRAIEAKLKEKNA